MLEIHGCQDPNIYCKKTTWQKTYRKFQDDLNKAFLICEEDPEACVAKYHTFIYRVAYCEVMDQLLMKMYLTPTKKKLP